ncbi:hypothetical protein KCU60_g23110, partial [Aureobasidium melanogenum]
MSLSRIPRTLQTLRPSLSPITRTATRPQSTMTTAAFKYIDPTSFDPNATEAFKKPWGKVDGPGYSFRLIDHQRQVENLRGQEANFNTDTAGFAVYKSPSKEKEFTDDNAVREG